jgi:hypothetical protein
MDVRRIMIHAMNRGFLDGTLKVTGPAYYVQLSDMSGVEVDACKGLMRGIKECRIRDLEDVLDSLGYQLTAVESKQ